MIVEEARQEKRQEHSAVAVITSCIRDSLEPVVTHLLSAVEAKFSQALSSEEAACNKLREQAKQAIAGLKEESCQVVNAIKTHNQKQLCEVQGLLMKAHR